jgi:hypothetical protein
MSGHLQSAARGVGERSPQRINSVKFEAVFFPLSNTVRISSPSHLGKRLSLIFVLTSLAIFVTSMSSQEPTYNSFAKRLLIQPLVFEANHGQADRRSAFIARGYDYVVSLSSSTAWLNLSARVKIRRQLSASGENHAMTKEDILYVVDNVSFGLQNANHQLRISGEYKLPRAVSYLLGRDPSHYVANIPTFARVRYSQAYPGIDLVYYGDERQLEFDFDVAPRANPRQIEMQIVGARRLSFDSEGNLKINIGFSSIFLKRPAVYQEKNGKREPVGGRFRRLGRRTIGVTLGPYDRSRPLVIDPILTYSTYLGSSSNGSANAVAVDAAGNAYVAGSAMADFPVTSGAFQTKFSSKEGGGTVAFVSKFDPNGNLIYSTYLGGSVQDGGNAIAVDAAGNAYVAGYTASPDFPVTAGAFQTTDKVSEQPGFRQFTTFVAKLNPTGTALVYSTFLGGSASDNSEPQTEGQEQATGIVLDASGNTYVTGFTYSTDFPTTSGAFQTNNPGTSTSSPSFFVTKLNAAGSALDYSTYMGGKYFADPPAIAVDSAGSAYIAGGTAADNYPTTPGAFDTTYSSTWGMAVVTKLNPTGTGLVYSTYLGGSFQDFARAIAVDSSGSAYVTGQRLSNDFPVTAGTIQGAAGQVFFTRLNPSGSALVFSGDMGLGGAVQGDYGNAIAVDSSGNVYLAGQASANGDFPATPGAFQTQLYSEANGVYGSFFAKLNSTATAVDYLTYLSGSGSNGENAEECDCINGMALDSSGNAIVVGQALSADFPTTPNAFEPGSFSLVNSQATNFWPFVTKFNAAEMTSLPQTNMNLSVNANPQYRETPLVLTAAMTPASGNSVPTGSVEFSGYYGILCNSLLDSTGAATCSTTDLTLGPNPVRVAYYGDPNDAPATQMMTETITGIPTTTTITVSPNSVTYGTSASITAQVTANVGTGIPTSAVIFSVPCAGNTSGMVNLDSTGHASCSTATDLPPGTYSVTANYTGDPNYAESTSTGLPLTVQPLGVAPAPAFSPAGGTFTQQINVMLSTTAANSTIYYTTDGSTPTVQNGNPYSVPITVNSTETIQAITVVPGYTQSAVASQTYTFSPNFTVALSPTTLSLTGTQSVTSTVTIASEFGFNAQVNFSCSGLPAGTTCSFSPSTVTGNPQQSVTTTLTIAGTGSAALSPETARWWPATALAVVVGLFGFRRRGRCVGLFVAAAISISLFALSACGGGGTVGGGGGNQTPITSTVTVATTSGTIQNTATLTVTYTP